MVHPGVKLPPRPPSRPPQEACCNCWRGGHGSTSCPQPRLTPVEREALRKKLKIRLPMKARYNTPRTCANCWRSNAHEWDQCPNPPLTISQKEALRIRLNIPMEWWWKRIVDGLPNRGCNGRTRRVEKAVPTGPKFIPNYNSYPVQYIQAPHPTRAIAIPSQSARSVSSGDYYRGRAVWRPNQCEFRRTSSLVSAWLGGVRPGTPEGPELKGPNRAMNSTNWRSRDGSTDGGDDKSLVIISPPQVEVVEQAKPKPARPRQPSPKPAKISCTNCWASTTHYFFNCPARRLRIQISNQHMTEHGIDAPPCWKQILRDKKFYNECPTLKTATVCFNCWRLDDHQTMNCRAPQNSIGRREEIRCAMGLPLFPSWQRCLIEFGFRPRVVPDSAKATSPNPSEYCENCWQQGHHHNLCGAPVYAITESEELRAVNNRPLTPSWQDVLADYGVAVYSGRKRGDYIHDPQISDTTGDELCWNCWSHRGHSASNCTRPKLSIQDREALRKQLGVSLPRHYKYLKMCENCWKSQDHDPKDCPYDALSTEERERMRYNLGIPLHPFWKFELKKAGIPPINERDERERKFRRGSSRELSTPPAQNSQKAVENSTPANDGTIRVAKPTTEQIAINQTPASKNIITQLTVQPVATNNAIPDVRIPAVTKKAAPITYKECFNCWDTKTHDAADCPLPQLATAEREELRCLKQVGLPSSWQKILGKEGYRARKGIGMARSLFPTFCENCWERGHSHLLCEAPLLTVSQCEALRYEKGVPVSSAWKKELDEFGVACKGNRPQPEEPVVASKENRLQPEKPINLVSFDVDDKIFDTLGAPLVPVVVQQKTPPIEKIVIYGNEPKVPPVAAPVQVPAVDRYDDDCVNCWKSKNHRSYNCPEPERNIPEKEALRRSLNAPLTNYWAETLRKRNMLPSTQVTYTSQEVKFIAPEKIKFIPDVRPGIIHINCTNCWKTRNHRAQNCPEKRLSLADREELRYELQMSLHPAWKSLIEEARIKPLEDFDLTKGYCTNCREKTDDHTFKSCGKPKLSLPDRERLRAKKGVPAGPYWQQALRERGVQPVGAVKASPVHNDNGVQEENPKQVVDEEQVPEISLDVTKDDSKRDAQVEKPEVVAIQIHDTEKPTAEVAFHQPEPPKVETVPSKKVIVDKNAISKYQDKPPLGKYCNNCWKLRHHNNTCPKLKLTIVEKENLRFLMQIPLEDSWKWVLDSVGLRPVEQIWCKNCWEKGLHRTFDCPKPKLSIRGKEELRFAKGAPLEQDWKDVLSRRGFMTTEERFGNDAAALQKFIHEYELLRCWNCWEEGHGRVNCKKPELRISERENLRIKLNATKPKNPLYDNMVAGIRCKNCWVSTTHEATHCPHKYLSTMQREKRRVELGIPLNVRAWKSVLDREGIIPMDQPEPIISETPEVIARVEPKIAEPNIAEEQAKVQEVVSPPPGSTPDTAIIIDDFDKQEHENVAAAVTTTHEEAQEQDETIQLVAATPSTITRSLEPPGEMPITTPEQPQITQPLVPEPENNLPALEIADKAINAEDKDVETPPHMIPLPVDDIISGDGYITKEEASQHELEVSQEAQPDLLHGLGDEDPDHSNSSSTSSRRSAIDRSEEIDALVRTILYKQLDKLEWIQQKMGYLRMKGGDLLNEDGELVAEWEASEALLDEVERMIYDFLALKETANANIIQLRW